MRHSVKRLHKSWAKSYTIQGQGQQHLGLVYVVHAEEQFTVLEPGLITDAKFEGLPDIRAAYDKFTSWTRLLLESKLFLSMLTQE